MNIPIIKATAISFSAAILCISCAGGFDESDAPSALAEREVTLEASLASSDPETRTVRQSDGKVFWCPEDAISLFYGSGENGGNKFTSVCTSPVAVTNFTGTIGVITGGGEISMDQTYFWGVYPYSGSTSCDGTSLSVELPSHQKSAAGSFSSGQFPTVGRSQGLSMAFYNICGGIKFTVVHEEIRSVEFHSLGNTSIAGNMTVSFDSNGYPVVTGLTGNDTIVVTPEEGDTFVPGADYYVVIPPVAMSSGLEVTYKTLTEKATKTIASSVTITRSIFSKLTGKDEDLTFEAYKENEPEVVDLGLSVKWASCNVGASSPEEYGGYYQWAGLEDVTDKSINAFYNNCPYCIFSSNSVFGWTKYVPSTMSSYWSGSGEPDNKTVLDLEDDVAHVKLGGKWRMPTKDEFQELLDNCTSEWTTIKGIDGAKFTSNINGNSIFLPAAGARALTNLIDAGSAGYYCSSSLFLDFDSIIYYNADDFNGLRFSLNDMVMWTLGRCVGATVRPVYGDAVKATGISLNKTDLFLSSEGAELLNATLMPSNCAGLDLSWSSDNTSVATVSSSGFVTAVSAGSTVITVSLACDSSINATCTVTVVDEIAEPNLVDMGLPSGIKWGSFNLGAFKPEDYGGHYQWAGLEDVTDISKDLNWDNCPYHTGPYEHTGWTKYVCSDQSSTWSGPGESDNKTALDLEDDVAHIKLGGKWRMPTYDEFQELLSNCTSEWTTLSGVKGMKVTSKVNGNSIFFPSAGSRCRKDLSYSDCSYWSSSSSHHSGWALPLETYNDAYYLDWSEKLHGLSSFSRYNGLSVRPVYGDVVNATGIFLNRTSLKIASGYSEPLMVSYIPSNCYEKGMVWSSNNTSVATIASSGLVTAKSVGTAVITVSSTRDRSITASCTVTVVDEISPEPVELGLPSGIKWASCNLGAVNPEDCGGHFQWAGLEDVTASSICLDLNHCPYHVGLYQSSGWTKYVPSTLPSYWYGSGEPDNKSVLDPEDDVAHVKLGGKWRMPTKEEFQELLDNCTSENISLNGVEGIMLKSKVNGNSIFLPAAGLRTMHLSNTGFYGHYWTSSLDTSAYSSITFLFGIPSNFAATTLGNRYGGQSVRPVSE